VIAYRAMVDVPRELVLYVSGLLAAERCRRGTRRKARALTCFQQALFALVWFRKLTSPARKAGSASSRGARSTHSGSSKLAWVEVAAGFAGGGGSGS
jgi:hypothetical protein